MKSFWRMDNHKNLRQHVNRYALGVEYDGSEFCGWQIQKGVATVQQTLETAISAVANHPVRTTTAGRTDTGVHATGQVVHFDTQVSRQINSWVKGVNSNLPSSVAVTWARLVPLDFHARFSVVGRTYRYIIFSRKVSPAILSQKVTWTYLDLDENLMATAADDLVGCHDFSAYRSVRCQSHQPVLDVQKISINRRGDWIWIDIDADGFLHHMVRNIAGVLIAIGSGQAPTSWAKKVLDSRDRRQGGVTASADGLYLSEVRYPAHFDIPPPPPACKFW